MNSKTLQELYAEHQGKLADKWSLYLVEYDHIFDKYRNESVRLLEIGIQNGGSLELWAKYFPYALNIVGCDINPDCAGLVFEEPNISIVVGDANSDAVETGIFAKSSWFDIIIDDGSHKSSDIVKSFSRYFPHLEDGGIYIVEDLHCSYWQEFEGGLFDPFSSITFFKHLADIINSEHWGAEKSPADLVQGFITQYGFHLDMQDIKHIHSIEFINSMCVIRKKSEKSNQLGKRVLAGLSADVIKGMSAFNGTPCFSSKDSEISNKWTMRSLPPGEELLLRIREIEERDKQLDDLDEIVAAQVQHIDYLEKTIKGYQGSTSWRVTLPLRLMSNMVARLTRYMVSLFRCETKEARELAHVEFEWCVDSPKFRPLKFVEESSDVEGWSVNLSQRNACEVRINLGGKLYYPIRRYSKELPGQLKPKCTSLENVGFIFTLHHSFGLRRLRVEFKNSNDTWLPIIRSWVFRMPKIKYILNKNNYYDDWVRDTKNDFEEEKNEILRHIDTMIYKPSFATIIMGSMDHDSLMSTIKSVKDQVYPYVKIYCMPEDRRHDKISTLQDIKELNDLSSEELQEDYLVFLKPGQCLAPNAIYEFANTMNIKPDVDIVYGDEDLISPNGIRHHPFYKPDWSPDYLETFNYISFTSCFRKNLAQGILQYGSHYDLVLRFTEQSTKVEHVRKILGHNMAPVNNNAEESEKNIASLARRLERTGRFGEIYEHDTHKGCYNIVATLKTKPLVSIIIPIAETNDTAKHGADTAVIELVRHIRERSTYNNIEIIVVENGKLSNDHKLIDAGCNRIVYSDEMDNIPSKINLGAAAANGEILLFIKDSIKLVAPSWIEYLVQHFEKPHVGVVGAKILFLKDKLQHVGVVHNYGKPYPVRQMFPRNDAGYFFSTCGVRNYSAVTWNCMATLTSIFREVGGFSQQLTINYSDADYCQKVISSGLYIVYEPAAELIDMEAQSCEYLNDTESDKLYQKRWANGTAFDKYYNEEFLTINPPTFETTINKRLL